MTDKHDTEAAPATPGDILDKIVGSITTIILGGFLLLMFTTFGAILLFVLLDIIPKIGRSLDRLGLLP